MGYISIADQKTLVSIRSQTIAEWCFHMIADDRRMFCDLQLRSSAIIWKPGFTNSSFTGSILNFPIPLSVILFSLKNSWEKLQSNVWLNPSNFVTGTLCLVPRKSCYHDFFFTTDSHTNTVISVAFA